MTTASQVLLIFLIIIFLNNVISLLFRSSWGPCFILISTFSFFSRFVNFLINLFFLTVL